MAPLLGTAGMAAGAWPFRASRRPDREPIETLHQLRIEMSDVAFSAQYQRGPHPPGGNRFRWEWFGTYDEPALRTDFQLVVQSWDTGFSAEPAATIRSG